MKKKIAICANGWNIDTLSRALEGIKEYSKVRDFDTFTFMCFASYSEHLTLKQGELNIYKLINPEDYDGLIVFSTMLNDTETAVNLCRDAMQKNIPVVSVGMKIPGAHSICVSNEEGMRELVEHLISEHNVKSAFFIAGTPDHVDSVSRLDITKRVFEEHGISFTDDDFAYGKWSNKHTADIIDSLVDSPKGLPDAIICANDVMAMAACTQLEKRGYLAPEDVIVTGYDGSEEGKIFYPALTTVEQSYEKIGYRACEMIFEQVDGDNALKDEVVPSRLSVGESCGCRGEIDYEAQRLLYCRHSFQRTTDAKLLEQNERVMRQWLSEMPSFQVMKETLQRHYEKNHQFEGGGFYIIVNSLYFKDVLVNEADIWSTGRESAAEVIVALKDGVLRNELTTDWDMIVPGYRKISGEYHNYFIMPLHYFEYNYGYLVLTDKPYIMAEDMLYPYLEKLQQSLRLMRINLRLKQLYEKDQLTGLLNRFGYEEKALPLYEESLRDHTKMMVMFVDINYMKKINDEYGHFHGDNAITTVVKAINDSMPEGGIGVRFGGDEFLVIAPHCNEKKAYKTKFSIINELEEFNKTGTVPYSISVSIGYVVTDPENRPNASLQDYIKDADNVMYEIKKETHRKLDRRK